MENCFCEMVIAICFEKDVPMREVQSDLSGLISNAMLYDRQLKEMHRQNQFKSHVFCAPYPLEPDRTYHRGRIYCFHLRTLDLAFALKMKNYLTRAIGVAKVVAVELRNYKQTHISELVSLSPIICTVNNRCWMPENGLGLLAERLHSNAVKKCKALDDSFGEPGELFFERIELLNRKPIIIGYKGTTLLGHKVKLNIKPQKWAQQLAFTTLGGGLNEKNALGFGYCISR